MRFNYQGKNLPGWLFILIAGLAISPGLLNAQPQLAFTIKPNRCLVEKPGDSCQFTAQFQWQLSQQQDVCLWQESLQLMCWSQIKSGEYRIRLNLSETTEFYLMDDKQQILASRTVQLLAQQAKQYRRRLHSQWSLF